MVVVVEGRVVLVVDVDDEVVGATVVDVLVDVVGAAGLVVLVVVVAGAPPTPGAAHAARHRAPVVTAANNRDPRPMTRYRQVGRGP